MEFSYNYIQCNSNSTQICVVQLFFIFSKDILKMEILGVPLGLCSKFETRGKANGKGKKKEEKV